jgi:hypothetical protein
MIQSSCQRVHRVWLRGHSAMWPGAPAGAISMQQQVDQIPGWWLRSRRVGKLLWVTGLELLLLGGGRAGFCGGLLVLWAWLVEREKHRLLDVLKADFDILDERRGNVDRPLSLVLRGRDAVCDVDAVVRGDHALWQLRQREAWGPDWAELGRMVIVDVQWRDAVTELRGLQEAVVLSPRYAVHASNVDGARAWFARDGLAAAFVAVLRHTVPAKAVVVDPDGDARVQVFVELPRLGLHAHEAQEAIVRLRQIVRLIGGEHPDPLPQLQDVGVSSPSGSPLAVPSPT